MYNDKVTMVSQDYCLLHQIILNSVCKLTNSDMYNVSIHKIQKHNDYELLFTHVLQSIKRYLKLVHQKY